MDLFKVAVQQVLIAPPPTDLFLIDYLNHFKGNLFAFDECTQDVWLRLGSLLNRAECYAKLASGSKFPKNFEFVFSLFVNHSVSKPIYFSQQRSARG